MFQTISVSNMFFHLFKNGKFLLPQIFSKINLVVQVISNKKKQNKLNSLKNIKLDVYREENVLLKK